MLRLYTDESPGLKVDPVVVLVLSLGFIMSVVALHSESYHAEVKETDGCGTLLTRTTVIAKITRKFS